MQKADFNLHKLILIYIKKYLIFSSCFFFQVFMYRDVYIETRLDSSSDGVLCLE